LGLFSANPPQYVDPIQPGKVQVKDQQVVVELRRQSPGLLAVVRYIHGIVLRLEPFPHEPGERRIIFGDENPHLARCPSICHRGTRQV
jgi:hypothetical protein